MELFTAIKLAKPCDKRNGTYIALNISVCPRGGRYFLG